MEFVIEDDINSSAGTEGRSVCAHYSTGTHGS